MQDKSPQLGPLGAKFFAYAQLNSIEFLQLGDLQTPLGLSAAQERRLLGRLSDSGLLFRVQPGAYMVPETIPAGGHWQPNEYSIIATVMRLHQARYYVGGLAAFNRFGLTTQVANQYTVYNDKLSGLRTYGRQSVRFIKLQVYAITGFDELPIPMSKLSINMATLARTIFDAINDYRRYQSLPLAFQWLENHYHDEKFIKEFIGIVQQVGNQATIRRIGFFLDELGVAGKHLNLLLKSLRTTSAWIALVPDLPRRGKIDKKWRIIQNAQR